jgi:hypothetical protein
MGLESKDPLDLGVNLRIIQLGSEGTIGTIVPQIHPYCHLLTSKWLNKVADEGPQEVRARQPVS